MTRSAAIRRALLPMLVVAIPACGGGGGGQSVKASPVALSFPAGSAITDDESIAVRGTVAFTPPISAVRVNGVDATTLDGFRTFKTEVPLARGVNDLVVEVERPNLPNETFLFERRVTRIDPFVSDPADVAFDAANGRLLLVDSAGHSIVAVDPASGTRTVLSDRDHGIGPLPQFPAAFDVDADGAFGFVLDLSGSDAILKINLANGLRTLLSGAGVGFGPDFVQPNRIAFDPLGERLLVTDAGRAAVFSVNVKTGTRSILSDSAHGAGADFVSPLDVAVDAVFGRALVSDRDKIVAVDLASGDRSILSDATHGNGDPFEQPTEIAVDAFMGALLVADGPAGRIVFVDLPSGNRSILFDDDDGSGTGIGDAGAITADPNDGKAFFVDESDHTVVSFDFNTRLRGNLVEPSLVGSGPSLARAGRVALDPSARVAWVTVEEPPAVVRVDLATGVRTTFSDATHGQGPAFVEPVAIALDAARGRLLVADDDDDSLWSVSLKNGARTLLSIEPVVAGNDLHRTFEIVLDVTHGRALLVQNGDLILAVDLATGARSAFSFDDPVVFQAAQMDGGSLDLANDRLLLHDQELGLFAASLDDGTRSFVSTAVGDSGQDGGSGLAPDEVFAGILITPRSPLPSGVGVVDAASGALVMLSTSEIAGFGGGPALKKAVTLSFDAVRRTALVFDQASSALFEVDLFSGDRVIVSR